ncbi:glycosyltransferase family 39 protein [Rhizobium sp. RU36D]|uniref:glycosyltransferase family 39 protein n=1 Tax=Rhizobium sp. RU36D TaxID=1907415 RepID=UPI0009D7A24C|nr:glycosyltransferase family 39 protein [Rhizobium sp. RU36D]SMC81522.1 Dolichyl-phosphate-mannose-protein mannosyltransferase [Rhizobium sp. RU36D]
MQERGGWRQNWQTKALLATIAIFTVVLTLHADWSRFNLDEWGDMPENYAWGVLWQWGYFKHPPFFAWAVAAWFSVMPHTDFAYYAFASLNMAVALYCLWRIALRYGGPDYQLFVILAAVLIPPLSFQAIKYNANSAMTPVWAAVFLFYLRGLERQRWYDAVVLGALTGVAMLTKYHSAVLVFTLLIHALVDRQARSILLSWFGLITAVASIAVFSGHAIWLFQNDFRPITYAASQGDGSLVLIATSLVLFLTGMAVYLLPAVGLAVLLRAPNDGYPLVWLEGLRKLRETVTGRALLAFGILPTILTIILAFAAGADLSVVWVLPLYVPLLLLVGLLLPPDLIGRYLRRGLVVVGIYMVALLVAAPIYKESIRGSDIRNMTVPVARMSAALDEFWVETAGDAPGFVVAGEPILANSMSFYSRHHPLTLEANSLEIAKGHMDKAEIDRRGLMVICRAGDEACLPLATLLTQGKPDAVTRPFTIEGFDGERQWPFVVTMVKPQGR